MSLQQGLGASDDFKPQIQDTSESDYEEDTSLLPIDGELNSKPVHQNAGRLSTAFNMLSNVIGSTTLPHPGGAGVLALPSAFGEAEMLLGVILLALVGIMSALELVLHTWGAHMATICEILFAVLTGSTFSNVFKITKWSDELRDHFNYHDEAKWVDVVARFTTAASGLVFLGLSSLRSLHALHYTSIATLPSFVAFALTLYMAADVSTIGVKFLQGHHPTPAACQLPCATDACRSWPGNKPEDQWQWLSKHINFFQAIPMFTLAFNCHYNVPHFYEELRNRQPKVMYQTVGGAVAVIFTVYYAVAYPNVKAVLAFNGSLFGTTIVFTIPGLLGLRGETLWEKIVGACL
eukprot:gene6736-1205_t